MNRSFQDRPNDKPHKLICVGDTRSLPTDINPEEVVQITTAAAVLDELAEPSIEGVWIARDQLPQLSELRGVCQSGLMLRDMPEGVALLDVGYPCFVGESSFASVGRQDRRGAGRNVALRIVGQPGNHGSRLLSVSIPHWQPAKRAAARSTVLMKSTTRFTRHPLSTAIRHGN